MAIEITGSHVNFLITENIILRNCHLSRVLLRLFRLCLTRNISRKRRKSINGSARNLIVKSESQLMAIKVFPALLRRKGCLLITAGAILVPFTIFILIIGPDLRIEQNLSQKLAECQMRLQYLESMYRTKQEDVSILSQYLGLTAASSNTSDNNSALNNFNNVLESLSPESKAIIRNLTMSSSHHRFSSSNLRLPSAYHFLPHLLDDPASLRPAYLLSKGRTGVSIVLGQWESCHVERKFINCRYRNPNGQARQAELPAEHA